jgi:endonuclease-3
MDPKNSQKIFERFYAHNPNPSTELIYASTFELLIAVILSAQATDISVNKATQHLFKVANHPQAILDLGLEPLKGFIQSIGLYHSKAANIMQTCQRLITQYQGEVPNDRAGLESLPGVGRKTANVILNTAFSQPTIAVDTHIFRVANRTGLASGNTPLEVEKKLLATLPVAFIPNAHHWLILHGRYLCQARKPKCHQCYIQDLCEYPHKIKS